MLDALVAGETHPERLADLAQGTEGPNHPTWAEVEPPKGRGPMLRR